MYIRFFDLTNKEKMFEETMRIEMNRNQSYLDFLMNLSDHSRLEEHRTSPGRIPLTQSASSKYRIDGLVLKEKDDRTRRESLVPQSRSYLVIEVAQDTEDLFEFKRIIVYDNQLIYISKNGMVRSCINEIRRIIFGRSITSQEHGLLRIMLKSEVCSRSHFSIIFDDFFTKFKLAPELLLLRFAFKHKMNNRIFAKIVGYFGREVWPTPKVYLEEEGSILGTWINIPKGRKRLIVNDLLLMLGGFKMKVEAIYHKEFNFFYKEMDDTKIQRQSVGEMEVGMYGQDLVGLFRSVEFVITNAGILTSSQYSLFVQNILESEVYFSCLLIDCSTLEKNTPKQSPMISQNSKKDKMLFICVNSTSHRFEMDGIAIDFQDKSFWLNVKGNVLGKGFSQLWKSVSWFDGSRFTRNGHAMNHSEFIMINNSILRFSSRFDSSLI